MPTANKVYDGSLKAASSMRGPVFRGGTRGLARMLQMIRQARVKKPKTRIVHPYPICGIRCWNMTVKIRPPVALPQAQIPTASILRFAK